MQKFEFMTLMVLNNLFVFAINGDVAAAKVYLSALGKLEQGQTNNTLIQQQNNFVQVNGIKLNQNLFDQLSDEQVKTLEKVIPLIQKSR